MHQSIFAYNITKPYPFRWFTWAVVLGGTAAITIFSVINLAANGYTTTLQYVTDINVTEHPVHPNWFEKRPWSWASKVSPTCQPAILTIGSYLYTNNSAFLYRVTNITKPLETQRSSSASIAYRNDPLHDCSVLKIVISTSNNSITLVKSTATLRCTIYEVNSPVQLMLDMSLSLDPNPFDPEASNFNAETVPLNLSFGPNGAVNQTQAGLFWGWKFLTRFTSRQILPRPRRRMSWGYWNFDVSEKQEAIVQGWVTLDNDRGIYFPVEHNVTVENWSSAFSEQMLVFNVSTWNRNGRFSIIESLTEDTQSAFDLDGLAKIIYSTTLTDVGQAGRSNLFVDPRKISIAANVTDLQLDFDKIWGKQNQIGLADQSNLFQVAPAVIATQYLCQMPKLKSVGSLIVSILVADLVFLQALWKAFTWIVTIFVERQQPAAMDCIGCQKQCKSDDDVVEKDANDPAPAKGYIPLPNSVMRPLSPPMKPSQITEELPQRAIIPTQLSYTL